MATHSSILAWGIPWTEEAGGLQTTGAQRSDMKQLSTHAPTLPIDQASATVELLSLQKRLYPMPLPVPGVESSARHSANACQAVFTQDMTIYIL